jgi:hypothetical protein
MTLDALGYSRLLWLHSYSRHDGAGARGLEAAFRSFGGVRPDGASSSAGTSSRDEGAGLPWALHQAEAAGH